MNTIAQVSSAPPIVYIDLPPDLIATVGVLLFTATFHLCCAQISKIIYL